MALPNEKGDERVGSHEPFHTPATHTNRYAVLAVVVIALVVAALALGAHFH